MAARVTKKVDAAAAEEECAVKRQSWIAAMFAAACLSLTHSIGRLLACLANVEKLEIDLLPSTPFGRFFNSDN